MEQWLKVKTAGLPRWAWIGIGGSAIIIALYLRSQSGGGEEEEEEEGLNEGELGYYDGTETAGGLASAGLLGPAGGSVLPVESPYLPEGFVDALAQITELASLQGAYITEKQQTDAEFALGGAPEDEPFHFAPEPESAPSGGGGGSNCTAKDRREIARLTAEIKGLNTRIGNVNAELKRLNAKFSGSKNKKQREHIRRNITKRQQQRQKLQGSRDHKRQKRDKLRAKCK